MQIQEPLSCLEERVVDFGTEQALKLLGRALVSDNTLTNVCFPDAPMEANAGFSSLIKEEIIVDKAEEEINIKLILNRENNNVLCAEIGDDFVNMMFSFLTFPLGSVFKLLSDNILGGCIKNLYSSAESMGLECFKSEICRNMLLNPKLPTFYGCSKSLMPQLEEITSKITFFLDCPKCYFDNGNKPLEYTICPHNIGNAEIIEWNPKSAKTMTDAGDAFVVDSNKYMISDNLQISPLSVISAIGGGMNLSNSNMVVKEIAFDKRKAYSLLGAMLISKTVLTDVFSPKPTPRMKSL